MDKPTLVLLPGMDGTGEMFEPFVAAMHSACDVLTIRYPNDASLGYAALEQLVRAQLPTKGQYVVLGESFSGPIAVSLSAAPAPGLMGVVLCCTFVRNPRPQLAALAGFVRLLPLNTAPMAAISAMLLGKYSNPMLRAALAHALAQVSNTTLQARLQAVLQVDARASIAAAKVPVLYLQASQDRVVLASATAEVKASLPAAKVVSIPGPHLLLQACPIPAAAALSRFMLGLSPDSNQIPTP